MRTSDARTTLVLPVLGCGLALGLLGDLLFHGAGIGINLLLWVAVLSAVAHFVSFRHRGALNGTDPWLLVAISFASCLAIRDAASLRTFNGLAVIAALGLAGLSRRVEPRLGRLRDYIANVLHTAFSAGVGTASLVMIDGDWSGLRGRGGMTGRILVGLLLAVPVVLVFGTLFANADPAFATLAASLVDWDIGPFLSHVAGMVFFSWLAAGLLRAWLWPAATLAAPSGGTRYASPGPVPIQIAVGAMVVVFAAFTAVQARWLFGGEAAVLAGTGLTYAALARQGFNEMVAASALAIPVLYGAEVLHAGLPAAVVSRLRRLGAVQLVLVLLTMVSALARVLMYTQAYGLSIVRINGTAIIVWLGAVIGWFGITVLRGRRERFTFGAVTSGLAVLGMLNIANPDAMIVRVNTERAVRGAQLDAAYLNDLSADAAPALAERLRELTIPNACAIGARLRQHWLAPEQGSDWRAWNLSVARARAAATRVDLAALGCAP